MKKMFMAMMLVIVSAMTAFAQANQMVIPIDKDVRIGKLDNGLTYYIRHNNWPEDRAEFYIAQRVGSIQEEDNQRGLAHFLEHMCFNGTDHFKGNDLIKYCESIGVKFGRDLNAYTSIDCTVYNISNVPTTRQSSLDSCLLILYDWANGLTLAPEEIDKERGVIHEEWRTRTSASMRMIERALPQLYPGSKYGERMPIGKMEVIDNFKPQVLRDYYEKWYRPDNQAVIVVGNVDVDHTEAEIKRLFAGIEMPANPAKVEDVPVPDNAEAIIVVDKDKEMQLNVVDLMFKHETTPDSMKNYVDYLILKYAKSALVGMLNDRLAEVAQKPDCPFVNAEASDAQYIFAKTKDAFDVSMMPKDGAINEAVAAAYREIKRAAEFGFTPSEYSRFKAKTTSALDKMYSNKDKRYSSQFCMEYRDHFLANEPIPSLDEYYMFMKQMVPMIPLEAINAMAKELYVPDDSNLAILSLNVEKEGVVLPTRETLLAAMNGVRQEQLTAYVDNVKDEPLIKTMPKKGKVKSKKENTQLGYTEVLLSNGVKVLLKHTDYKKDQVLLSAEGFGGSALYGEKDFANIKAFDGVIEASGLGNFSHTELEKALAGKIVSATLTMDTYRQQVEASSTPNDLETMMQLVYLYFTQINKDQESFDNAMKTMEIMLKNKALSPDHAFNDSLTMTLQNHNPRFSSLTLEDLSLINYDRILEMAKERTANAAAYTFTIVGNFDEQAILPLLEQYVASLPAQKKVVKAKRVDSNPKGVVVNEFKRKMETPKSIGMMVWRTEDIPYTLDNQLKSSVVGQILSMIYIEKIREEASAAYSAGAQGSISRTDNVTKTTVLAYCPMKPEKAELAKSIMRDEMAKLAQTVDADKLAKVKEYMLKNYSDQTKTNGYWGQIISNYHEYGVDFHSRFTDAVNALTPESVAAFVQELLKPGNRVEVVMLPQE